MLLDLLKKDLVIALKQKDALKTSTLRFLISKINYKQIEVTGEGKQLSDEDVVSVVKKLIKQHNQSIEGYTKGNRQDLVDKEQAELKILEEYYTNFTLEI